MRTNILDQIVSFPKSILRTGIEESTSREAEKNIIRLNLFLSFCLGISLINCIFNLANELFVSAVVNLAGTFLLTVAFYMNKDGQHEGSKKLGIITINLYLFCVSYVEGLRSGQYLLFFPLILALIFVIDLKRNLNEVIITSVVTLLTTAFIFILAPYQNTLQNIPQDLYSSLFSTNLAIALLLTTVFAYLILKTLENHEDKILEEKMLSDTIFDTSLDAVFIVRVSDLVITDCNKRALEVFRHDYKKSLIQIPVERLLGVQMRERISSIKSNGFIKGSPWYGNMDFEKQDDSLFYAYVNLVPFNHQNELYCKISILDITEIKVAEFEIIKAKERAEKAAKVKSRFLSNMSHELRTPLNAIIGTSNILLQEEYMESQREYFDVLKNSSEHMLQLVNDILDLSKLEAGKMELENVAFNLNEFLHKVVAPFNTANSNDMKLEMEIDPVLNVEISGDQTRLQQVLNNLLSNAKKFTKSGKITVTARAESRKSQNVLCILLCYRHRYRHPRQ